jgi:hypothetical protein
MRMVEQILAPGVQYREKTDLSAQVILISGNLKESCGAGAKQEGIDEFLVVEDQRSQSVGECKDNMHVGNGQKFLLTGGQPLVASVGQTLRTMPVPAAVVRDGHGVTASGATIPVTAERRGTTVFNGSEHLSMQSRQPRPMSLDEVLACRSDDISHLDGWLIH